MNKTLIGLGAVALVISVVGGIFGAWLMRAPLTGGDFAGGQQPSQLFSASAATNSVTPNLSNLLLNGAISVGGTAAANQATVVFTATSSYPSSQVTLGPVQSTTSTAVTAIGFQAPGLAVGDACEVAYNGVASTSNAFGADAFITAANGGNVTATVTFWNGATSTTALNVTSTATGASSTLKTTCFHTGV